VSAQAAVAEGTVGRMFADPALVTRRLGQGAFRLLVTDGYDTRPSAVCWPCVRSFGDEHSHP
jgi:hypothetical protein